MSELIIPDGYGNAVFSWQILGRLNPITVTLGYNQQVLTTADDVAQAMYSRLVATGAPCNASQMHDEFTFIGVECKQNDSGVVTAGSSSGPAVSGTISSGDTSTINTTLLVQKRTTRVGRKFRGRMYWPISGLTEAGVDYLGNIDSSSYAILKAQFDDLFTDMASDTATYTMVLLHSDATVPTDLSGFALQQKIATQRRRLN